MIRFADKKTKGFTPHHFCSKSGGGFTLIELLVVIAIIGLLISINLIVVARYRDKAKDARIETSLAQARKVAVMIYNDTNSYETFCKDSTLNDDNLELKALEDDVMKLNGDQNVDCQANQTAYCVKSPLAATDAFCVDSAGYAGEEKTNCSATNIQCSAP